MHGALQHVGAGTAEGERAYEQSEHEQRRVGAVEPKMHLLSGDQPDGEHRRNGEADGGERRAETHIHRPLQLIGERRVEGGQSLRREHQNGNENAAKRRRRAKMLDAEIDNDRKLCRQRHEVASVISSIST